MDEIAIVAEGLGKRFRLRHGSGARPNRTLREDLLELPRRLFSRGKSREEAEDFWALRDVTFEVKRGEVLGIIGRNGAGKSTLLKVLSRIMDPTCGEAIVRGRIGSLLEVGTGFHPELTGRENIFLSGALLGMRREEIRRRFDEIVAFAGVEQFLDTPCKHYSSGMYTRLGFAVAAHLEAEILLVDEVLAVGDAEFQSRCLGKIGEIVRGGRTVLLVSHNMAAIQRMSTSVALVDGGRMVFCGQDVRGAVRRYLDSASRNSAVWMRPEIYRENDWFSLQRFALVGSDGEHVESAVSSLAGLAVEIEGKLSHARESIDIGFALYGEDESCVLWSYQTDMDSASRPQLEEGTVSLRAVLPSIELNEGRYRLEFVAAVHATEWIAAPRSGGPALTVEVRGIAGESAHRRTPRQTLLVPVLEWRRTR